MSKWLAPRLDKRIQILKPIQDPNSTSGGFDRSYETLLTVWGELKPLAYIRSSAEYIRGVQITENVTHSIVVRRVAVQNLGRSFSSGFSIGFESIPDLNILKSDMFMLVQQGSTVKGRLFRVRNITDVKEEGMYLNIMAEEIEEKGTGYPI